MKTTILVLTLNEIECVPTIMPQIRAQAGDAQILMVDGGSTDGTVEWCRLNGFQVYEQMRPGIRFAYIEAMPLCEGDIVLTLSPDGNCPIDRISDILRNCHDLSIGSRYGYSVSSQDDDAITAFGNFCFRWLVRILHGLDILDPMVIFRCFRKNLFYELDLDKEESYSLYERLFNTIISIEPLMTVRAIKAKKNICEVEVGEPARIGGTRKLQIWRWGAAYLCQIIRESWYWKPA